MAEKRESNNSLEPQSSEESREELFPSQPPRSQKSKKLPLLLWGVIIAGLILAGYLFLFRSAPAVGTGIGELAPDFTLSTLEGQLLSLQDLRGKKIILNFFATWCKPCQEEMPYLQAIQKETEAQGVKVVIVDIAEGRSTVQEFMQQRGYTMTVVLDRNSTVTQRYGVIPIPTTFLIDREGIIRYMKVGAFQSTEEIAEVLRSVD